MEDSCTESWVQDAEYDATTPSDLEIAANRLVRIPVFLSYPNYLRTQSRSAGVYGPFN